MIVGYTLKQKLASGTSSEVWLASRDATGEQVIVKRMQIPMRQRREFEEKVAREVDVLSRLGRHGQPFLPEFIEYLSLDEPTGAVACIIMTYIEGQTLREHLDGPPKKCMDDKETMRIFRDIGGALAYLHRRGLVHRDVKPDNIICREDGTYVLVDLGVAREVLRDDSTGGLRPATVTGTPNYRAPELRKGMADDRTDIFALGVTLYECLTGDLPWGRNAFDAAATQDRGEEAHLSGVFTPPLRDIIRRMLFIAPAKRFEVMRQALDAIFGDETVTDIETSYENRCEYRFEQGDVDGCRAHAEEGLAKFPANPRLQRWAQVGEELDNEEAQLRAAFSEALMKIPVIDTQPVPQLKRHIASFACAAFIVALCVNYSFDLISSKLAIDYARTTHPYNALFLWLDYRLAYSFICGIISFIIFPAWLAVLMPNRANALLIYLGSFLACWSLGETLYFDGWFLPLEWIETSINSNNDAAHILIAVATAWLVNRFFASLILHNYGSTCPKLRRWLLKLLAILTIFMYASLVVFMVVVRILMERSNESENEVSVETLWENPKRFFDPRVAAIEPELAQIPSGTFQMGSNEYDIEKPIHTVTVETFFMGKYEVTYDEYDAFCDATRRYRHYNNDGDERGRRPVPDVTWDDATAYCQWLSQRTGKPYRLPTEAEWEYAARGGKQYEYATSTGSWNSNLGKVDADNNPSLVGSYPPNPFGLHDMSGNVYEWCQDRYSENNFLYSSPRNPEVPKNGNIYRVIRGGATGSPIRCVRTAYRDVVLPASNESGGTASGFRVARSVDGRRVLGEDSNSLAGSL